MLPETLRVALLIAIFLYFVLLFVLLRKRSLSLRYTLLWLVCGLLMLLVTLFPQILTSFTRLVGIELISNALFAVLFFCIIIILVSLTSINSKQSETIKRLVQETALLEERVRKLEGQRIGE